jgi:hypothetical protein
LDGRRGVDGIGALTARAFENENGWSKRGVGVTRIDSNFTITVGDKFELAVNELAVKRTARGAISIDMRYPGHAPIRVLSLDVRDERVSSNEYRHAFHE